MFARVIGLSQGCGCCNAFMPPADRDDSTLPYPLPPGAEPPPKDGHKLTVEPDSATDEFADYSLAVAFIGPGHARYATPKEWAKDPDERRRMVIMSNVASYINMLMMSVRPIVTDAGTPTFKVFQPSDAMSLLLYNQFTGASGIRISRNPHCPNRFFSAAGSKTRKGRSDRAYCGRAACQRYCYDHPEKTLGPIRQKKNSRKTMPP